MHIDRGLTFTRSINLSPSLRILYSKVCKYVSMHVCLCLDECVCAMQLSYHDKGVSLPQGHPVWRTVWDQARLTVHSDDVRLCLAYNTPDRKEKGEEEKGPKGDREVTHHDKKNSRPQTCSLLQSLCWQPTLFMEAVVTSWEPTHRLVSSVVDILRKSQKKRNWMTLFSLGYQEDIYLSCILH